MEGSHGDDLVVQGVKGFPCIWHASQELQEQYGLPSDLPKDLVSAPGSRSILTDPVFNPFCFNPAAAHSARMKHIIESHQNQMVCSTHR